MRIELRIVQVVVEQRGKLIVRAVFKTAGVVVNLRPGHLQDAEEKHFPQSVFPQDLQRLPTPLAGQLDTPVRAVLDELRGLQTFEHIGHRCGAHVQAIGDLRGSNQNAVKRQLLDFLEVVLDALRSQPHLTAPTFEVVI